MAVIEGIKVEISLPFPVTYHGEVVGQIIKIEPDSDNPLHSLIFTYKLDKDMAHKLKIGIVGQFKRTLNQSIFND